MKYLWEFLLKAQEQNIDLNTIRFQPARRYSPYIEISQAEINNEEIREGQVVELNPYYRFYTIFKDMFHPDITEYEDLRYGLFQLIFHFLSENDLRQGMNRGEYYKKFLYQDMLWGAYGNKVREHMQLFDVNQRNLILNGMLKLYSVGDSLDLLQEMLTTLFKNTIIYNNTRCSDEILVYIGMKSTKELNHKVQVVLKLFANLNYKIELYYQYHFAVLGLDATSSIGEIALY